MLELFSWKQQILSTSFLRLMHVGIKKMESKNELKIVRVIILMI